jgi:hypothetical protein
MHTKPLAIRFDACDLDEWRLAHVLAANDFAVLVAESALLERLGTKTIIESVKMWTTISKLDDEHTFGF